MRENIESYSANYIFLVNSFQKDIKKLGSDFYYAKSHYPKDMIALSNAFVSKVNEVQRANIKKVANIESEFEKNIKAYFENNVFENVSSHLLSNSRSLMQKMLKKTKETTDVLYNVSTAIGNTVRTLIHPPDHKAHDNFFDRTARFFKELFTFKKKQTIDFNNEMNQSMTDFKIVSDRLWKNHELDMERFLCEMDHDTEEYVASVQQKLSEEKKKKMRELMKPLESLEI